MKLRAAVKRILGTAEHYKGSIQEGFVQKESKLPDPAFVQIEETEGGFLLLHLDSNGECITDSWHPTLEDAKAQAKFEFDIDESDWK